MTSSNLDLMTQSDAASPENASFLAEPPAPSLQAGIAEDQAQPAESATSHGVYVTVHGHFYQPPRENPYLDAIERQPSAAPFHDWNERIHHECYRPNAFARILNHEGKVMEIVNTFEYLSFNIGPTLISWLERYDVEVYQRIIEADHKSRDRLNGHGNAIAQVYNHIILPLASERDKRTQIRWGKADFKSRFGRDPEGMWRAETAVDYATRSILAEEGIRFIILAPSQAQRCRPLPSADHPDPEWVEVGGGQIDPVQPYRCYVPHADGNGGKPYVDIFFYDGPISRDMGFNEVLSSSQHFAGRIGQAVRGDHREAQLISVATDGETFGHHKGGAEKA
ncbi:MAG: glycoside hydrolase, partial [Elainellaceae cyanobacterium]